MTRESVAEALLDAIGVREAHDGIGEERPDTACVRVRRVEHHGFGAPELQYRVSNVQRRRCAHSPEALRELAVTRDVVFSGAQSKCQIEHDPAVGVAFENTVTVPESTIFRGKGGDLHAVAIEDPGTRE